MKGLLDRIGFAFQVNYHSNGQWLLYAEGWQIATPTADDPIYFALSGNLDRAGDPGLPPGPQLGRPLRHQRRDDRLRARGRRARWPGRRSCRQGCPSCGFVFPDDEALVQEEFERNLPFALVGRQVGARPGRPRVRARHRDQAVLHRERRPVQGRASRASTSTFAYSYGDPQPVQVLAKRSLGAVTLKYQINGGAVQSAPTSEWNGGERYKPADVYYHELRGVVTGTEPGRLGRGLVRGRRRSAATRSPTRPSPRPATPGAGGRGRGLHRRLAGADAGGPHYLDYYLDALAANGVAADVYDVDARGRIGARPPRRAQPLRRGDLVHGRRHRHPRAGLGRQATPTGSRSTRSSSSAPT